MDNIGEIPGGIVNEVINLYSRKWYIVSTALEIGQDYWSTAVFPMIENQVSSGTIKQRIPDFQNQIFAFIRNNEVDAYKVHSQACHIITSEPEVDWFEAIPAPAPPDGYSEGAKKKLNAGGFPQPRSKDKTMTDDKVMLLDVDEIVNHFFDDSSIPLNEQPMFVLYTGGVGAGKTTLRRQSCAKGYVVIDSGEIYAKLISKEFHEFESLKKLITILGSLIATRAIKEKRNIVMEIIGSRAEEAEQLIDSVRIKGYRADVRWVTCDVIESRIRHLKAVDEDPTYISSFFTEKDHQQWILDACK